MASRSLRGCAVATGEVVCTQPDKASAVMAVMIGNRNARATRTGAIPSSETASVLHWLWLTKGFLPKTGKADERRGCADGKPLSAFHLKQGDLKQGDQAALTPAPIGHDTPVPPSPQ
jgi:hypothetical protein